MVTNEITEVDRVLFNQAGGRGMTQEQALFDELYSMAKAAYDDGYQASRESIKQKLMSDEMVTMVEDVIDIVLTNDGEETTTRNLAKAALQAVVGVL